MCPSGLLLRAHSRPWWRHCREVIAQSLKHGLTQHAPIGDAAELDLGQHLGPDPSRLRLDDRLGERRFACDQRIEALAQRPRGLLAIAAARLAGIGEPLALAPTDI